jgi:hypothetical protein
MNFYPLTLHSSKIKGPITFFTTASWVGHWWIFNKFHNFHYPVHGKCACWQFHTCRMLLHQKSKFCWAGIILFNAWKNSSRQLFSDQMKPVQIWTFSMNRHARALLKCYAYPFNIVLDTVQHAALYSHKTVPVRHSSHCITECD